MKDIEALIDDLGAAERAGVFARTPQVNISSVVTSSSESRFLLISPRWAIAAAFVMAAGVGTLMFRANLSDLQNRSRMVRMTEAIDLQSALASCVGGPSIALNPSCGQVDFDGDGDVDLVDVGTYQRELAGTSQ